MNVKINQNIFKVKTLIDKRSQAIGMMGKTFDKSFEGLLFLMGGDKQCFWMKNCIVPLDIIFIHDNKITKIHHNCPPCKTKNCENYCGYGDLVLELPGGYCEKNNIKESDILN